MKLSFYMLSIASLFSGLTAIAQSSKTEKNLDAKSKTTFFNLEAGKIVKETEKWDLAFNNTTIKINSKQNVSAQILSNTKFDQVTKAPESGYKKDSQSSSAIPTGSGNGWYNYDMATHALTPIPGKIIIVKTASGKHVKLEVLSYYFDEEDYNETGFYTFRYAVLK